MKPKEENPDPPIAEPTEFEVIFIKQHTHGGWIYDKGDKAIVNAATKQQLTNFGVIK